jgi:RNA ligase
LHRLISNVTPLAIWEAMSAGADMDAMRRELPEEFWEDFDFIREELEASKAMLVLRTFNTWHETKDLSDKELGLRLGEISADIRPFLWERRKCKPEGIEGNLRTRASLYRLIRPTGNQLEGYRRSSAMQRVE